jgi:hypothetical protein
MEAVFSIRFALRLYNEDPRPAKMIIEGSLETVVEYD